MTASVDVCSMVSNHTSCSPVRLRDQERRQSLDRTIKQRKRRQSLSAHFPSTGRRRIRQQGCGSSRPVGCRKPPMLFDNLDSVEFLVCFPTFTRNRQTNRTPHGSGLLWRSTPSSLALVEARPLPCPLPSSDTVDNLCCGSLALCSCVKSCLYQTQNSGQVGWCRSVRLVWVGRWPSAFAVR